MSYENIVEVRLEIECLQESLEEQRQLLIDAKNEVHEWVADEYEHEQAYKESLDEEGTVTVCGIEFEPSTILEELDPTAYRCGLADYLSNINIEDDSEGKILLEEVEDCETRIEELEEELAELEEELDELSDEDEE